MSSHVPKPATHPSVTRPVLLYHVTRCWLIARCVQTMGKLTCTMGLSLCMSQYKSGTRY